MATVPKGVEIEAAIGRARNGEAVRLADLDWAAFQAFLQAGEGIRLRYVYTAGSLEIMPTSRTHEIIICLLSRLVEVWAMVRRIPFAFGGTMDFTREDLQRGISPDGCYWIASEPLVRGRLELDFRQDPPPDLMLEAEVSQTILARLPVLAALGVPEVWRCAGSTIRVGLRQPDGQYQWGDQSQALPGFPLAEAVRFLQRKNTTAHSLLIEEFREWVQQYHPPAGG
jgi:Uma2 family endonuclease